MAFEITVREALAILQLSEENPKSLFGSGELTQFVVRDYRGRIVWRFLHYEEILEPARTLARKISFNPSPSKAEFPSLREPVIGPELVSIGVAARLMDVTQLAVQALVERGQLRVARTSRMGHVHLHREEVVAFIETRRASRCSPASRGRRARAGELVDVPTAALLLRAMPVRVYAMVRAGLLEVAHVSADGARCFRRDEVLALAGSQFLEGRRPRERTAR